MDIFTRSDQVETLLDAIANDTRRGSGELALAGLKALASASPGPGVSLPGYRASVRRLAARITRLRPAMPAVANAVAAAFHDFNAAAREVEDAVAGHHCLRRIVLSHRREIAAAKDEVARRLRADLAGYRKPITISYSSAVARALAHYRYVVTVCESRPRLEGRRLARALRGHARKVTLVTEAGAAIAVKECDCVVLGCDAVYPDGSIANKTGSLMLSRLAGLERKPTIILADRLKLVAPGHRPFESHAADEIWKGAPPGVAVVNEYFERLPAEAVHRIVMPEGVWTSAQVRPLWREAFLRRRALTR